MTSLKVNRPWIKVSILQAEVSLALLACWPLRDQQPRKVSSVSHDGCCLVIFPYILEWRWLTRLGERSGGFCLDWLYLKIQEVLGSYELCFGEGLEKHRVVLSPRETSRLVRFSFWFPPASDSSTDLAQLFISSILVNESAVLESYCSLLEIQNVRSTLDLLNQNLLFNKVYRWFVYMHKITKLENP